MNSTDEYWEVDGQSLQTFAFNIESWGEDRQAPPSLRGDNITIPHAEGQRWSEKIPDSRLMTLSMWVVGAEEDGSIPISGSLRDQFRENWAMLRKLLWTPHREFTLTKRIKHPVSGLWVPVTAKAQFADGLSPSMLGGTAATFTVDIFLADPFFYGDPEVIDFTLAEENQEFVTLGDARTSDITLTFKDALTNPKISDALRPELWVQYASTLVAGASVSLDVRNFKATYANASGSTFKAAGNVKHSGEYKWLYLEPGPSDLIFSASAGSGSAQLTYLPKWF